MHFEQLKLINITIKQKKFSFFCKKQLKRIFKKVKLKKGAVVMLQRLKNKSATSLFLRTHNLSNHNAAFFSQETPKIKFKIIPTPGSAPPAPVFGLKHGETSQQITSPTVRRFFFQWWSQPNLPPEWVVIQAENMNSRWSWTKTSSAKRERKKR